MNFTHESDSFFFFSDKQQRNYSFFVHFDVGDQDSGVYF